MHFLTTVVVHIPQVAEDDKTDREVLEYIEILKVQLNMASEIGSKIGFERQISELRNYTSAFRRAVVEAVGQCLEPYDENTEDPKYLEFDDMTDEITRVFNSGTGDYVRMPGGKLIPIYYSEFSSKYVVKNGLVYEKDWGPLKSLKRTKRAKKIIYLKDYPLSKIYKTIKDLAEDYYGAYFNEETQSYGRYINFNCFWDWYRIGGRWPKTFLVKEECVEYSIGNIDNVETLKDAPAGYKWTSVARKKDICWDAMITYRKQMMEKLYADCKEYFIKKEVPRNSWLRVETDGIYSYDKTSVYLDGETLDANLKRRGYSDDANYLFLPHFYVDSRINKWYEIGYAPTNQSYELEWLNKLREFYKGLDDDAVLVTVDVHN